MLAREDPPEVVDLGNYGIEDVFDAWVFAAGDATLALDAWIGDPYDGGGAYVVYRAALDREEKAASVLADALRDLD